MTFDFAPDRTANDSSDATPVAAPRRLPVASRPAFAIAQRPTCGELTALVGELFREGSLTWEQMRSLAELPDFGTSLLDSLVISPPNRNPMAAE